MINLFVSAAATVLCAPGWAVVVTMMLCGFKLGKDNESTYINGWITAGSISILAWAILVLYFYRELS